MLLCTVNTCSAFFGTVILLQCYSVWLIVLRYGDITVVLFGAVIIRYSFYSCGVLRYVDITAVLFCAVIVCVAFFFWVISLQCYSVELFFVRRSSVG